MNAILMLFFRVRRNSAVLFLLVGISILLAAASPSFGQAHIATPPGAPWWWNNTNSPFWSYHDDTTTTDFTEESNNGEFRATLTLTTNTLIHATLDLENGFSPDLYKRFYIWLEGSSSAGPTFLSLVADNNGTLPNSVLGLGDGSSGLGISYDAGTHLWQLSYGATATPQPDRVILTFDLPLNSTITHWEAGEQCLTTTVVPEPAALSLFVLLGCAGAGCRRVHRLALM